jgi:hypothetical protein
LGDESRLFSVALQDQMTPSTSKMMTISNTRPKPPVGR